MERARRVLALEMVQLMNLVFLISLLLLNVFPLVQAQVTGKHNFPTNFSLRSSVFVMIPLPAICSMGQFLWQHGWSC